MSTAALAHDAFMPAAPEGMRRPLLLALAAHGVLLIALAIGVNWRAHEPEGVQAELWAAVPQISGQRAEAPPPPRVVSKPTPAPTPPREVRDEKPVRDAQIAIEKDKARKEREKKAQELEKEQTKKELEKQKQLKQTQDEKLRETDKKQRAAETARADAEREKNLQDIMRKAGATAGTGTSAGTGAAAQTAGPSASYAGRIKGAVRPNITFNREVSGNPVAEVRVQVASDGTVLSSEIIKSSGVPAWDEAVLNAIIKTAKFPRNEEGRVPSPMILSFKVND